jgi:60 kDa SS-A/Ro ribonucleoprotein
MRGWGRQLRTSVADWYLSKDASKLAYQLAKYQSRNGWSNADLLRLSHANPELQPDHKILLNWAVKGWESVGDAPHPSKAILPVWAFEKAKRLTPQTGIKELVRLIAEYDLPRECIPTEFLAQVEVWDALLQKMPMTAMIRNLGKMTSIGLVSPNSEAARMVGKRLEDAELLHKARIHPISVLMAQSVYKSGHGMKGSLSWSPVPRVVNALGKAFYASFANAPKTGKRFYIGLDVSGSMGSGNVAGTPLTPREAAAAMAMVTMKTEDEYYIAGFTNGTSGSMWSNRGYGSGVTKLELTPDMTLDAACRYTAGLPFGGTDCALPMLDAAAKNIPADVFMVITDSETWAGNVHPTVALQQYRNKMKIDAKLIVMGVVANEFTIADPTDAGQMDVVGFDASVPQVIAQFIGVDEPIAVEED